VAGADGRPAQTGCGRGRRERGRHGAWLITAGGQATIEPSAIVACNNKRRNILSIDELFYPLYHWILDNTSSSSFQAICSAGFVKFLLRVENGGLGTEVFQQGLGWTLFKDFRPQTSRGKAPVGDLKS